MSDLIAKLEAASEGSRELDTLVCEVKGACPDGVRFCPGLCPSYTTSLDAALTLVPEGYRYRFWAHHTGVSGASVFPHGGGTLSRAHDAPTPALALCIAALKARTDPEMARKLSEFLADQAVDDPDLVR